jgi:hypothetical protein
VSDLKQEVRDEPSVDLFYDLQFRSLEQLSNLGVASTGITITLIGTILHSIGPIVWLAVIEFGLAALAAFIGQMNLIASLRGQRTKTAKPRLEALIAMLLLGMGVGSLGTSIYLSG